MDDDVESRGPYGVSLDDEKEDGCCEVICIFPDLKVKKKFSGGKFVNKLASGTIDHKFSSTSLELELNLISKRKVKQRYVYRVKELPDEVVPEDCKVTLKDGKVILLLKKVEAKSWQRKITANGLDQNYDVDEGIDESVLEAMKQKKSGSEAD